MLNDFLLPPLIEYFAEDKKKRTSLNVQTSGLRLKVLSHVYSFKLLEDSLGFPNFEFFFARRAKCILRKMI